MDLLIEVGHEVNVNDSEEKPTLAWASFLDNNI